MKLTRKQLIYLIKENLNEVGELTRSGMVYTRKELERFYNKLKEVGIEIKEGTGKLKGMKVVWIDNVNKLERLPIEDRRDMSDWLPVGRCHIYELSTKDGLEAFNAFFRSVGVKKFKVYLEAAITVRSLNDADIFGSSIAGAIKNHNESFNFSIGGSDSYRGGQAHEDYEGRTYNSIIIYDEKGYNPISFKKEMADLDVCNENIPAMKTLELKDLIRKPKKKGKPKGPDALKDLAKSQLPVETFDEDRLGPADIKLNPIEQYSTKTGQKGVLRTKEQIESTGKSLSDVRLGGVQIQKGGINYYLVPNDYLEDLSDTDLKKMLDPEFDLPTDLDLD